MQLSPSTGAEREQTAQPIKYVSGYNLCLLTRAHMRVEKLMDKIICIISNNANWPIGQKITLRFHYTDDGYAITLNLEQY